MSDPKNESRSTELRMNRRDFSRLGSATLLGACLPAFARTASAAHHEGGEQLVNEIPANEVMVTTLQYTPNSAKDGQKCENCALFTAGEGGKGKCTLFQTGLVQSTGWCLSWSAKS